MVRVTITNQSFREAGGSEAFPNLSIEGIVYGTRILGTGKVECMQRADLSLQDEANRKGLSHVFKVEHQLEIDGHPSNDGYWCFSYGTGYRKSE